MSALLLHRVPCPRCGKEYETTGFPMGYVFLTMGKLHKINRCKACRKDLDRIVVQFLKEKPGPDGKKTIKLLRKLSTLR